ncbi:hypothetical protein ABXJ76_15195 [Methylobacter sp. G7]|uniref:hypothetical protein n=1 Tax=Methylobacter sp. G7 TaxID=3230117 RepID=UPI003D80473B
MNFEARVIAKAAKQPIAGGIERKIEPAFFELIRGLMETINRQLSPNFYFEN